MSNSRMKAVCVLSGGMDSTLSTYLAKQDGYEIIAVHFNYGQRTEHKELECFRNICIELNVENKYEINIKIRNKWEKWYTTEYNDAHTGEQFIEKRKKVILDFIEVAIIIISNLRRNIALGNSVNVFCRNIEWSDYTV